MRQYMAVKADYPDTILFFRMGDFYEMFNEDAKTGARVLGITLTSRGHGKAGPVPLAGFPYHALDGYLAKMIKAGYRVAICEQVEDPKLAKGVVKREVVQVVTPGTVLEEGLLETKRNNYVAALWRNEDVTGLASADVSTGDFRVTEIAEEHLPEELQAVGPAELLLPEGQYSLFPDKWKTTLDGMILTKLDDWIFSSDYGYEILTRHFKTASLKGFGCQDLTAGLAAAGAVLHYLQETQKTDLSHIRRLLPYRDGDFMNLDAATRRNLEILQPLSGDGRSGTLLQVLDHTRTPMGGRTLAAWLQRPLLQAETISRRLDGVEELLAERQEREKLADGLGNMGDLERLLTRTVTRRATPRDLGALGRFLGIIPGIKATLASFKQKIIREIRDGLDECPKVCDALEHALVDDPPAVFSEGGVIRSGYNAELDELRDLAGSGKEWIARLQTSERERTGIPSLKVGYNKVFGYYLEVTKPHLSKIPDDYIRKQTLVNAERFITPALKEEEEKILRAEEKMAELERRLFEELRDYVAGFSAAIQEDGCLTGILDSLLSLTEAAERNRYVKPRLTKKNIISIKDGRHPVVERLLPPGEPFIPNDVEMSNDDNQILIITGPNMAGKSTFIRQVGLIVLMAQIGSFVPAAEATIGIVDRIFTRVGAHDNLAGGESTFLVEMNETANILNNATPKSLILLDEIGRGTSTFDGLSIAWSVAEYLHTEKSVAAKTLFATHYHELTELALIMERVKNFNVAVKEWGDHIVFLRKIVLGGCDHSYGIQVAKLAGLPAAVIKRAKEVLRNLEENELTPHETPRLALSKEKTLLAAEPQLNLFSKEEQKVLERLKSIDVNQLTPLQALEIIAELREIIGE